MPRAIAPESTLPDVASGPLGYQIAATAHLYTKALNEALRHGRNTQKITVPRLMALRVIAGHPAGISGAALSRAMGTTPQSTSTLLHDLAREGWLNRPHIPGTAHTRSNKISPAGKRALTAGLRVSAKVDERLADAYSHDGREAEVLGTLLRQGREVLTPDDPQTPAAKDTPTDA